MSIARPRHVVIADDDYDIRRLVALTLRRDGFQVTEAIAGDTALELIRTHKPDLAILDISMPALTGFEVIQQLTADEDTRDIPVLLLTARAQMESVMTGAELGARSYILKPFRSADLLRRVRSAIGEAQHGAPG